MVISSSRNGSLLNILAIFPPFSWEYSGKCAQGIQMIMCWESILQGHLLMGSKAFADDVIVTFMTWPVLFILRNHEFLINIIMMNESTGEIRSSHQWTLQLLWIMHQWERALTCTLSLIWITDNFFYGAGMILLFKFHSLLIFAVISPSTGQDSWSWEGIRLRACKYIACSFVKKWVVFGLV